jgi:Uma2 family endonuclease
MADITRTRMTAAEFASLPETPTPPELIDGEVIVSPTPRNTHQAVVRSLLLALTRLGEGEAILSPMDVYLDDDNVVQPDLFWVSGAKSRCQLGEDDYWHGAPDLVVEVLSPGTARRDRGDKYDLYQRHGVREYWIVDPAARFVEVFVYQGEGFTRQGLYGPEETFASSVLAGREIGLEQIFGKE